MTYTAGTLALKDFTTSDVTQITGDIDQVADVTNAGSLHVFAKTTDGLTGMPFCLKNETSNDITVEGRFAKTPSGIWRPFIVYAGTWSLERVIEVRMPSNAAFPTGLKYGIR